MFLCKLCWYHTLKVNSWWAWVCWVFKKMSRGVPHWKYENSVVLNGVPVSNAHGAALNSGAPSLPLSLPFSLSHCPAKKKSVRKLHCVFHYNTVYFTIWLHSCFHLHINFLESDGSATAYIIPGSVWRSEWFTTAYRFLCETFKKINKYKMFLNRQSFKPQ